VTSRPALRTRCTHSRSAGSGAEAAFQDQVWRPRLEPLRGLARIRVVHCTVSADVAFARAHMIEEYARHNGHADLIRERLDGVTGT